MRALLLIAATLLASPLAAQEHAGHAMPMPMAMPAAPAQDPHAGHAMPAAQAGTDLPPGNAPAPPLPADHYADRTFPAADMAAARDRMMRENGAQTLGFVMIDLAEYQVRKGRDGYRWEGEGWFGGDYNRFVLKTEGEGDVRGGVEAAEVQALYAHALDPYFNLQAGIRQDIGPGPDNSYLAIGLEGLAPYWFDIGATAFLSTKGDLLGRIEGYYDQRITQRLVLQPRAELEFAAQDMPETRIGRGLTSAELGLRLRYEITRQFAPYVGVSYEAKSGRTADFARADGDDPNATSLVAGLRIWF